ncbi:glycosyltransferase family 1 protein [Thermopirellula anaerolimosa]
MIVFADDWGRHPSSCQHLVRFLMARRNVLWVNTIGMRRPRLDRTTMRRGWEKLRQWLGRDRTSANNPDVSQPTVARPLMWPSFSRRWERAWNRRLLTRQLEPLIAALPRPRTAVTTIPIVADLMGLLPVDRWVYYRVDDFRHWPEMDGRVMAEMESRLISAADRIVAASERLREGAASCGRDAVLLTHGVDWRAWQNAAKAPRELWERAQSLFAPLAPPRFVFWGSINWQMDTGILSALSQDTEAVTILVGPVTDCPARILRLPRVKTVGPVSPELLPLLAELSTVLIMPYKNGPGLEESQPLKLKEYLATRRPVVVRDLPANRAWSDALDLADSPDEFVKAVRLRIETGLPTAQETARRRIREEGWEQKAAVFDRILFDGLSPD